jgi:hypothetical protein
VYSNFDISARVAIPCLLLCVALIPHDISGIGTERGGRTRPPVQVASPVVEQTSKFVFRRVRQSRCHRTSPASSHL